MPAEILTDGTEYIGVDTNLAFWASNLGADLGLESLDVAIED